LPALYQEGLTALVGGTPPGMSLTEQEFTAICFCESRGRMAEQSERARPADYFQA
jgi:hypothetical protein